MGCCLTTPTATVATAGDDHHHHHNSKPTSKPQGGPPAPEEEETVKEVLSETPIKPPPPPPSNSTGENQHILLHPQNDVVVRFTKTPIGEDEVSSSEMYTYSESFSNATTTTTTTTTSFAKDLKKPKIGIDEDGEVNQKVKKRPAAARKQPMTSSSGERARRKERGIRPPAPPRRSTIPSTDKKIQIPTRNNITTSQRHRNVIPSNSVRRESPARRPRSPVIWKVKEKSPVPKSGDRNPVNVTENKGNFKSKKNTEAGVSPAPGPETEICESLENPLVSLECFIFL